MPLDAACGAVFKVGSTPMAVRNGLRDILAHPSLLQLPGCFRGDVETVLAEAMNNIVEHAYDRDDGIIELRVHVARDQLFCEISDNGYPMPGDELPKGLAQPIGKIATLPEGGFGWFLIRSLTNNLTYRRIGARNHLSFQLKIEQ